MLKSLLPSLAFNIVLILLMFLPAGTFAWPQGWVFFVIFNACSQATGIWLLKTNPELLKARMQSPVGGDQRPRDRAIAVGILLFFAVWLIFMALDARRFGWSHVPLWAQIAGALLILAAFWGWVGVLRANSFAATTIGVQKERGQRVISSGPYAVVRHPMYAWALLLMVGMPLLLGSLWGLIGILIAVPLLAARALGEEAVLFDGLPGYPDYAARVRYRLVPGVW
jgi:protein-S-isoprenylcysteine O-methyltransferase Ste14